MENNIKIKPLTLDDAEKYFKLIESDRAHLSQFGDTTAKKYPTLDSVRDSIISPPNPGKLRFGIWVNNAMVGSVNLTPTDLTTAELGVWIGKKYTGNRFATKALKLLVEHAFTDLNYKTLFGLISVGNEASRKSIEKLGFKLTDKTDETWTYTLKFDAY